MQILRFLLKNDWSSEKVVTNFTFSWLNVAALAESFFHCALIMRLFMWNTRETIVDVNKLLMFIFAAGKVGRANPFKVSDYKYFDNTLLVVWSFRREHAGSVQVCNIKTDRHV